MKIPECIEIRINNIATADLSPRADGLKECWADTRLNGESVLEFMLPATSEKIKELTPECEIWTDERVYILRKDDAIDTIRDDKNVLWTKVMAVEKWYELDTSYIEPYLSNDHLSPSPADLSVIIVGGGSNLSGVLHATGTAAHALYAVLQGSGWTMGTVDVAGVRDFEVEKSSRLQIIKQIQEIWGGYLLFDSVNKIVHLRDANKWQPYTGFSVEYGKNLKHITRTESNKIITKLYAFGHDDLDIASVNGGKKYITNHSYTPEEYVSIYKNQDVYDPQELKEKAIAELALICRPRYLYKVKLVDVRVLPDYEHEEFTLGDMVDIIDPDVAPDSPSPRIIRHKYNLFQPWKCELDIGDPEERLVEQLKASFGTAQFVGGKFNGSGKFSGHSLEHDTVVAKHIKAGSVEIGHLDDGVVPGLNLLENPTFSSYAEQISNIDGKVSDQATLIQQNSEQISLQAISINNLGENVANLDVKADEISSSVADTRQYFDTTIGEVNGNIENVQTILSDQISIISQKADSIELSVSSLQTTTSSLGTTVSSHSSLISQNAQAISSKVSTTDYNGNTIMSLIQQTPDAIKLSASKIDLDGIVKVNKILDIGQRGDREQKFLYFNSGPNIHTYDSLGYGTQVGLRISAQTIKLGDNIDMRNASVDFTGAAIIGLSAPTIATFG